MADRDATADIVIRDKSGPGITSVERRLAALEKQLQRANERMARSTSRTGDDAARGFAAAFVTRVGPLVAKAPISPYIIAGIAAASPAIGAATAAAVLGGLSGGVVAAGIRVAYRDPAVKAEVDSFGSYIGARLDIAAKSFVPATIGAVRASRVEFGKMDRDLQRIFDRGATYVAPMQRAVSALVSESLPGIADALDDAAPVLFRLERGAGAVGRAVGDAMRSIGEGAHGAGIAVGDLLALTADSVRNIGQAVEFLSKTYAIMRVATATNKQEVIAEMAAGKAAAAGYQAEFDKLVGSLGEGKTQSINTAAGIRTLDEALRDFADAATTGFNAETRFGEVLDEATAKAYRNSAGINANTERGRANRDMLEKLAQQTRDSSAALAGMAGGQARANAVMGQGYSAFIRTARAMGVSKAEADRLARSLGLLPASKTITIRYPTMTAAEIQARALARAINTIDTHKEILIIQRLAVRGQRVAGVTGVGGHAEFAAGGSWRPAQLAAQLAADAKFAAGSVGTSRTGGAVQVHNDVAVSLDGEPFRAMTTRAVAASERRTAWRNRVGRR